MTVFKRVARLAVRCGFHCAARLNSRWTARLGSRRRFVILALHSVSGPADAHHRYVSPRIAVPPRVFERHVAFLAHRYHCVSMDAVHEALASRRELPPNTVAITFDDGYRDNYDYAYPILRRYGVPATFYVVTGCLDGRGVFWPAEVRRLLYHASGLRYSDRTEREAAAWMSRLARMSRPDRDDALDELAALAGARRGAPPSPMLTWSQIREMHRGGMSFGSHTVSHPLLPSVSSEEARREIEDGRAELEAGLGAPVAHFSYPNPSDGVHVNGPVRQLVQDTGYETAVTSVRGYVLATADRYALPRMSLSGTPWAMPWDVERLALHAALRPDRAVGATP